MDTFTSWHAAGFGFLYQLTGEQKYADLARQCVELMFAGKYDRDNRYSWVMPGTDMRASNIIGAVGYAYDFCYNAWDPDFRKKVALEIQNFDRVVATSQSGWQKKKAEGKEVPDKPEGTDIMHLVGRNGYPPGSNHYGALIGGVSVGLLAIRNDPGADTAWVDTRLAESESNISRLLEYGFGDGGYYAEGFPPSRLSAEGGLFEFLHALRTSMGRDYVNVDRPNVKNLSLRWVYHVVGKDRGGDGKENGPVFPSRGVYGGDRLYQTGVRASWAQGFGMVPEQYKKALNWTYQTYVHSAQPASNKTWNATSYPIWAVYAFLNWPEGNATQNPEEVLPKILVDTKHSYIVARNQWRDSRDIVTTFLVENGPKGYYASRDRKDGSSSANMRVFGLGRRINIPARARGAVKTFVPGDDGSYYLNAGIAVTVDFSKASGSDLVVVQAGYRPKRKKSKNAPSLSYKTLVYQDGDTKVPIIVYTLQNGKAPEVTLEGNVIKVGGQSYTYADGLLTPKVFTPAKN